MGYKQTKMFCFF